MAVAPAAQTRPRPGGGRLFIIVGLLMAVLAFGAVFLLGNTIGGGGGAIGGGPSITVVIAKQTIPVRHAITLADLDTEKVGGNFTNAGNTYSSTNDVINLISEVNITKGSVITSDMLARDIGLVPAGAAPAYLPLASGYVAMTIPTGEQQGVAGYPSVGDYITVISSASLTVFSSNGQQQGPTKIVSKTVFTNVRIIGLGPRSSSVQSASSSGATTSSNQSATTGVTSSLTIELTQCDAEYFTWFLNNTNVRYTLESFHDYLAQPPAAPDPTCPTVTSAQGVSQKEVDARYHFTSL
ncbi:MAG TPA: RcpC/CpaB family pilus assembly protein [Candidatus Dormibacteraeota bacterium]|nr:RcpC/CpaB family pilus assembly protein [Candidatus Dormibacteraeota bacterium]